MTTDNLTNEPTEAMILAGLNAYSSKGLELDGYETTEEYPSLEMWGDRFASQMRAALVAAQGAAPQAERDWRLDVVPEPWTAPAPPLPSSTTPQAEAYDHCCQHPKCPGGSLCCCASEQRLRDCWNQWLEEIAGDSKQAFRDGYQAGQNDPAPWLPAPVLPSSGVDEEAREFRFTDAQWREYQSIPMQGYSHRHHLEHVFNEWLKGQER